MIFSQKYCLVSFLKPLNTGYEFSSSEWPLHVTTCGVFTLELDDTKLNELNNIAGSTSVIESSIIGEDYFGPNQDVHVALVDKPQELDTLHRRIAVFILQNGGTFNEPQYILDGFKPHISLHEAFDTSTPIGLDSISLIDMFPDEDPQQRKILATFALDQEH